MSSYIKGMWKMCILKEKWLLSVKLKSTCLKSRWLWLYQQVSNALLGCTGGRLCLSNSSSPRCLCQQQHIHLGTAALRFTSYRNLLNQWYVPCTFFLIKTFVHLGCNMLHESLRSAAGLDTRFSTRSLGWPEQSSHCWKTVLLGPLESSLFDS